MTEIIPNLFIGNWQQARDSQGFHVVTVAVDSPHTGHEKFPLVDGPGNSSEVFQNAIKHVVAAYLRDQKILVHCVSGRSRSAAVIVGAIKELWQCSYDHAYDRLISQHDKTRIHPALGQLLYN